MRTKLICMFLICVLGLGVALTGCKDTGKKNKDAALLFLFQSAPSYFPEIPKGVAR
jgi:hypothetical protein